MEAEYEQRRVADGSGRRPVHHFRVLVLAQPVSAAIAMTLLFGLDAILAAVPEIGLGIRLRGVTETVPARTRQPSQAAG
jgi:hypothetical protein